MATTAKDWKGRVNQAAPLDLPSGNTALVRNPGMQAFLQSGIVPNDLMPIILKAINKEVMPDLDEMKDSPEKLQQIITLVDNVTIYCVVEPPVSAVPTEGVKRDEDTLYVDEVDIDDKMFIFQYAVGGTKDLEEFRREQAAALESLSTGSVVARPAKRAPRPQSKRPR